MILRRIQRCISTLAILATAGVASVASGQAQPASVEPVPVTQTPEDDILCAYWASAALGSMEPDDPRARTLTMALYFYLGRFEGQTGKPFGDPLSQAADYLDANPALLSGNLGAACITRMEDLTKRMQDWSAGK